MSPTSRFGSLLINPDRNPAILDTLTWDPAAAIGQLATVPTERLRDLAVAVQAVAARMNVAEDVRTITPTGSWPSGKDAAPGLPDVESLTVHPGSIAGMPGRAFVMAGLSDGQHVLLDFRDDHAPAFLTSPIATIDLSSLGGGAGETRLTASVHRVDSDSLNRYTRELAPWKGPRALGLTPRLGIGTRMSRACWPGAFQAMEAGGFAANAIQNSVRELNLLDEMCEARPPAANFYSGFGTMEAGHTGSTFEGLLVAGAVEALKYPAALRFGADADHLQVKRGPAGLARAKRLIDCSRFYSFFTLDVADVLDYAALQEPSDARAEVRAREVIDDDFTYRSIVAFHSQAGTAAARTASLPKATVDRCIGKHWRALDAVAELEAHIRTVKGAEPFDLELSMDEHPPELAVLDCITTREECLFVIREVRRRGVRVTHLAPNVGVQKGFDYGGPGGLEGLERRVARLAEVIAAHDMLIDIHSGDDLAEPTRAAIRRATGGRLHFKVSPTPQLLFASVLEDYHPDVFADWWSDAVRYAQQQAGEGSAFAQTCLNASDLGAPSHRQPVFHHFAFRFVGRRDDAGQLMNRDRLYSLSEDFNTAYSERLRGYLVGLARDLLA